MIRQYPVSRLLLGTLALAMLAAAPAAWAQRPDTARAVVAPTRQQALTAQLMRLRAEIELLRAELARSSSDAAGTRALRTTIESLVQSQRHLEQAIREHSASVQQREVEERTSIVTVRAREAMVQPQGWVGLTTENRYTVSETGAAGGTRTVRLTEPPVIVSVSPGSPAFRAGLVAGDTLLSINQRDARVVAEQLASMLRPGDTLYFRVRRADGTRVIPVLVEPRAVMGTFAVSVGSGDAAGAGGSAGSFVAARAGSAGAYEVSTRPAPAVGGTIIASQPAVAEGRSMTGAAGAGGTPGTATVFYLRQPGLAGARIEPLSRDLASKLGVESGLYVFSVAPETPSERAGLRAGDVIIGTAGNALVSLAQLQRALQSASARALELDVVRDRERRTVTLRW